MNTLPIDAEGFSSTGQKRPHNEDYFDLCEPGDSRLLEAGGCLYLVADGVGGKEHGEQASRLAVQTVLADYYHNDAPDPEVRLQQAFQKANQEFLSQWGDESGARPGSTLVAAAVRGDQLIVAHVGDSRLYLFRNGAAQRLTRDHSWMQQLIDAGELTPEKARDFRRRNVITRNIGGASTIKVDISQHHVQPGDILLLCSDGLHQYFWHDHEFLPYVSPEQTAGQIARRLVDEANARGGADNITALVIKLTDSVADAPPPNARPAPSATPSRRSHPLQQSARQPHPTRSRLTAYWPIALVGAILTFVALVAGIAGGRLYAAYRNTATAPASPATSAAAATAALIATTVAAPPTTAPPLPTLAPSIAPTTALPAPSSTPPVGDPPICAWQVQANDAVWEIARQAVGEDKVESQEHRDRQNKIIELNAITLLDGNPNIAPGNILLVPWSNAQRPFDPDALALQIGGQSYPDCRSFTP